MSHQDFEERVLYKRGAQPKTSKSQATTAARVGNAETVTKYGAGGNKAGGPANAHKLDDNERDDFKHKAIPTEFKKALMQARTAKGMSQKDLAAKIQEKPATIQSYENGSAIPNGQIISKLNRALGTTLPKIPKP